MAYASVFVLLNQKAMEYSEGLKKKGEPVYIDAISYEDFMLLGQFEMEKGFTDLDEQEQKERMYEEGEAELAYAEEITGEEESVWKTGTVSDTSEEAAHDSSEDSISYRMLHWHFTVEQKEELKRAMEVKIPKEIILSYFYPETSVAKMMEIHRQYE